MNLSLRRLTPALLRPTPQGCRLLHHATRSHTPLADPLLRSNAGALQWATPQTQTHIKGTSKVRTEEPHKSMDIEDVESAFTYRCNGAPWAYEVRNGRASPSYSSWPSP